MFEPITSRRPAAGSRRFTGHRPPVVPRWSPALINVAGLLVLLFFTGGSSRADVWSLPILRPIAILSLFYGLWSLSRQDIVAHRFLFAMAGAVVALIIAHLIPLPPFLWTALPGREIIMEIDAAVGLSGTWRPISMVPEFTWNALFALAIPLAILTNAIRLSVAEQRIVVMVMLLSGVLTVSLGLLQTAGGGDPAYYLYRLSNFGLPVGIFANRNHHALFLAAMLPLLGFILATRNPRSRTGKMIGFVSFAGVVVVSAFIVVLGSRAGLIAGAIGLVSFVLISILSCRKEGWRGVPRAQLAIGAVALIAAGGIIAWATFAGSAESLQRVMESSNRDEPRYTLWPIIADALPQFMPAGTGIGAYERVFQTFEPDSILHPTYSNHAHNDWLEVALTAGIPGIALMVVAVIAFFVALRRVWYLPAGPTRAMGWIGLVIILMTAIGSVVDYPLRAPIISALFSLASVWIAVSLCATRVGAGTMSDTQERFEGRVYL